MNYHPLQIFSETRKGNVMAVLTLLSQGLNVNFPHRSGYIALHVACLNGHRVLANILIENGANINAADNLGFMPLHCACFNGHTDVALLLIKQGAKIEGQTNFLQTPLHLAAEYGRSDVVRMLLQNGANPNVFNSRSFAPLHLAVMNYDDNVECVKVLVDGGANPNQGDENGVTPSHLAAFLGHTSFVSYLIRSGVEVNRKDNHSCTAFHWACFGNQTLAIFLLDCLGADLNAKDDTGRTGSDLFNNRNELSATFLTTRGKILLGMEERVVVFSAKMDRFVDLYHSTPNDVGSAVHDVVERVRINGLNKLKTRVRELFWGQKVTNVKSDCAQVLLAMKSVSRVIERFDLERTLSVKSQ